MFKSIFVFLKAHMIVTTVTTVAVVGTAVAAPIAIHNYMLDQEVKQNLGLLAPASTTPISNQTENKEANIPTEEAPIETIKSDEPVTFRVEIIETEEKDEEGKVIGTGKEFKVVPSYNKDYSKWTNKEKVAYQKVFEEANKMAEEEYKKSSYNEEQTLANIEAKLQKIQNSYTREYRFTILSENGYVSTENWQYNTESKEYSGAIWQYEVTTGKYGGIEASEFKKIVYPALKQKIGAYVSNRIKRDATMTSSLKKEYEQEQQKMDADLEELVSLSN